MVIAAPGTVHWIAYISFIGHPNGYWGKFVQVLAVAERPVEEDILTFRTGLSALNRSGRDGLIQFVMDIMTPVSLKIPFIQNSQR